MSLAACTAAAAAGDAPQAGAPAAAAFWTPDGAGRIVHRMDGGKPVVLCMQGRKVVMQAQVDPRAGLSCQARFFHVDPDLTKNGRVIAVVGRDADPALSANGRPVQFGAPSAVAFDGMLTLLYPESGGMSATRTIYPSTRGALVIEEWRLRNEGRDAATLKLDLSGKSAPATANTLLARATLGPASAVLAPGGELPFAVCLQARPKGAPDDVPAEVAAERAARRALAEAAWRGPGRLETPEPMLDLAFALQKLHVLECPVETCKGLLTHNGSLRYSPGIWANDPVEYSSPLFPFFGDPDLNRAAMNMYRVWLDHCRGHGIEPFPGSFEGPALELRQRERGDDAMVLYALPKFLLFQGDRAAAEEMWPLVEFAAASVLRHTTAEGIVASETDEMEGRYPTGDANLSTSSLAYGGYRLAASLGRALGKPAAGEFEQRAAALRKGIEGYFGAEVEGFKTYRYYRGNTTLRGWILLPLAMGIDERRDGTVAALLSDKLWPGKAEGADILAESTRPTEWGRETYYALRALFKAGRAAEALDLTRRVVKAQVFGAKGPYPDEDAIDMLCPGSLYPRVFTEGVFGIVPTGLDSFECTPRLPASWPRMALRDLRAFGRAWDLVVERDGDRQKLTVTVGGRVAFRGEGAAGTVYRVKLPAAGNGGSEGPP